jgi:putative PIN family toxin of toxin-antitoxin system
MTRSLRLVLDTNVFVAALISGKGAPAQLIRGAEERKCVVVASPGLLKELADVLGRGKFRRYLTTSEASQAVSRLASLAVIVEDPPASATAITADPDDDYLVLLAESAEADVLVSGDPHLIALQRPGLRILTPREAWDLIDSCGSH